MKDTTIEAVDTKKEKKGRAGTTLALDAYSQLREEILNASLAPGMKLRIRELCDRYGMGLSPIREALNRLASEGMVVQSAQRGFTVASFSMKELEELVRTKQWLNELGLRESIKHGDMAWEESVILAFHRLARTPRYTSDDPSGTRRNADWNNAHLNFHASLIDACRSEWLKSFCQTLFFASERYRALARLKSDASKRLEEHRAIMEATISRDADKAVALLCDHFETTARLVRANLEQMDVGASLVPRRKAKRS